MSTINWKHLARHWGKVGLLVDDDPDAAEWVARELYGTDVLPRWWYHARTVKQAADYLRGHGRWEDDAWKFTGDSPPVPVALIVDRFVPVSAGEPREDWWIFPEGNSEEEKREARANCKLLRSVVKDLQAAAGKKSGGERPPDFFVLAVSSYTAELGTRATRERDSPETQSGSARGGAGSEEIDWAARTSAPTFEQARKLEERRFKDGPPAALGRPVPLPSPLLFFGPSPAEKGEGSGGAGEKSHDGGEGGETSSGAASWWKSIRSLYGALLRSVAGVEEEVHLVLGPEVALRLNEHGAGLHTIGRFAGRFLNDPDAPREMRRRVKHWMKTQPLTELDLPRWLVDSPLRRAWERRRAWSFGSPFVYRLIARLRWSSIRQTTPLAGHTEALGLASRDPHAAREDAWALPEVFWNRRADPTALPPRVEQWRKRKNREGRGVKRTIVLLGGTESVPTGWKPSRDCEFVWVSGVFWPRPTEPEEGALPPNSDVLFRTTAPGLREENENTTIFHDYAPIEFLYDLVAYAETRPSLASLLAQDTCIEKWDRVKEELEDLRGRGVGHSKAYRYDASRVVLRALFADKEPSEKVRAARAALIGEPGAEEPSKSLKNCLNTLCPQNDSGS